MRQARTCAGHSKLVNWGSSIKEGALVEEVVALGTSVGDSGLDLAVTNSSESDLDWCVTLGNVDGGRCGEGGKSRDWEDTELHLGRA